MKTAQPVIPIARSAGREKRLLCGDDETNELFIADDQTVFCPSRSLTENEHGTTEQTTRRRWPTTREANEVDRRWPRRSRSTTNTDYHCHIAKTTMTVYRPVPNSSAAPPLLDVEKMGHWNHSGRYQRTDAWRKKTTTTKDDDDDRVFVINSREIEGWPSRSDRRLPITIVTYGRTG